VGHLQLRVLDSSARPGGVDDRTSSGRRGRAWRCVWYGATVTGGAGTRARDTDPGNYGHLWCGVPTTAATRGQGIMTPFSQVAADGRQGVFCLVCVMLAPLVLVADVSVVVSGAGVVPFALEDASGNALRPG